MSCLKDDQCSNAPRFGRPAHNSTLITMKASLRENGERYVKVFVNEGIDDDGTEDKSEENHVEE